MFRSGKRRPDEGDSVVPHGMVWYGTPETPPQPSNESTESTESPEATESLQSTVQYAQVMEMMRRRARAPAQQSREENGPQPATGNTRPAPIPWWRIPHPDPEEQSPALSSPTVAVNTPHPKPALPLKIQALNPPLPNTASSNLLTRSEVKNEVKEIKEVTNEVKKEEPARAQARSTTVSAAIINNFTNFTNNFTNFTRSSFEQSRRSIMSGLHELGEHGNQIFSRAGATAKAIRERAVERSEPPRVRLVLTGLPLRIKILVTRRLSEWKMRTPNANADTRLRSAMIMAAACAVLGLVGVSVAPRFAAKFLPSHTFRPGSTMGAKTLRPPASASAQPSRSAVSARPQSPEKRKSPATPAAAKSEEDKPSPERRVAQPKHHPTDDDDYVAPNTYKYYGQSGSR